MILTDGIHIVSDFSLLELRMFACKAQIKTCWLHTTRKHPHYDKPKGYPTEKLLALGAVMVSSRELARRCCNAPKRVRQKPVNLEIDR